MLLTFRFPPANWPLPKPSGFSAPVTISIPFLHQNKLQRSPEISRARSTSCGSLDLFPAFPAFSSFFPGRRMAFQGYATQAWPCGLSCHPCHPCHPSTNVRYLLWSHRSHRSWTSHLGLFGCLDHLGDGKRPGLRLAAQAWPEHAPTCWTSNFNC